MLLLSFPRNAWQFERPEKQGGSLYIKKILSMQKDSKMFFTTIKIQVSSAHYFIVPQDNDVG